MLGPVLRQKDFFHQFVCILSLKNITHYVTLIFFSYFIHWIFQWTWYTGRQGDLSAWIRCQNYLFMLVCQHESYLIFYLRCLIPNHISFLLQKSDYYTLHVFWLARLRTSYDKSALTVEIRHFCYEKKVDKYHKA